MKKLIRDLFYGPGNHFADLGRIMAFAAVLSIFVGLGYNLSLGQPLDLGPAGLGGGLGAVLGAGAAFLAAKTWERREAAKTEAAAKVAADPPAQQPAVGSPTVQVNVAPQEQEGP